MSAWGRESDEILSAEKRLLERKRDVRLGRGLDERATVGAAKNDADGARLCPGFEGLKLSLLSLLCERLRVTRKGREAKCNGRASSKFCLFMDQFNLRLIKT